MLKSKNNIVKSSRLVTVAVSMTAMICSTAYGQENYVELGRMQTAPSFEEVSPSQITDDFKIPVFLRKDYESQAVGGKTTPAYQDISVTKEGIKEKKPVKKSPEISRLEKKLMALKIVPIPLYKFGKEKVLKRKNMGWDSEKYKEINSFDLKRGRVTNVLPQIAELAKFNLTSANLRKINITEPSQKVAVQSDVDKIKFDKKELKAVALEKLYLKEPKDLDTLTADILFHEKDSCEEVVPLTEYLSDKKTKDNRIKFYRGICLHRNKMYTESIPLLAEVIGTSTEYYAMKSVEQILKDLPKGYEPVIAAGLAPKKVYNKLKEIQKDKYNYILAKGYFIDEKFKRAEAHSKLVSKNSPDYFDALFLKATSQYMSGKLQEGIATISNLKDQYFKFSDASEEFKSLIHVTFGRFLFERGEYNLAIKEYSSVTRSHPLWVDSLIEKGWSQIKIGDYKGAVGNMFTLQSPFFKDAYIPEAQVIQTIGYLNLCQFGDADETLSYLEQVYPIQKQMIEDYVKTNRSHYETLTSYITQDTSKIYQYHGLPTSVIREMGRDREYLVIQQKLNNIVDEIPRFNKFVEDLSKKAQELTKRIEELAEKAKELREEESEAVRKENTELAKVYRKRRENIFEKGNSLKYRIESFNKGIRAYKFANQNAVDRAIKLRDKYLQLAEKNLRDSISNVDARLDMVLKNNDLLRYEVYANSGKNIRYRTAGGATRAKEKYRMPSAVVADKDYGWKFKGEFWEDEIGNFRSGLKNLCPKNGRTL